MNIQNIDFTSLNNYLIESNNHNWFLKSILYASYNCVLIIPVLISIKDYISKGKKIKYISILVSIIIAILLITVYFILINVDVNIKELEMPAVYAISNICPKIKNIYGIIILISIFTTAISLGISFLGNVAINKKSYNVISNLICASAIIFSRFGFSNLVNLMYPILGMLGLLQIIKIILQKWLKTDIT